jgi:hypothetical protein
MGYMIDGRGEDYAGARRKRIRKVSNHSCNLKNVNPFHICSQRVLRLAPTVFLDEREFESGGAGRSRKMRSGSEALPQCCIHYLVFNLKYLYPSPVCRIRAIPPHHIRKFVRNDLVRPLSGMQLIIPQKVIQAQTWLSRAYRPRCRIAMIILAGHVGW